MARVKIKSPNSKDPRRLNLLLQILSIHNIYATRIVNIPDGFAVVTEEAELDRIFDGTTNKELENKEFEPLAPPEHKANRSVLIFRLDDHIYLNNEDDILRELLEQNDWISGSTCITKFKKGRGLKITFNDTNTAKKAQEKGLLLFSMRIPADNIIQDKYLNVTTCLRCYTLNEHYSANCPKDRSFKICSECSREGHTWRDCTETTKKCINCNGEHSTMAMSCRKRKEFINTKRREEKERPSSYVSALKQGLTHELPKVNFPDTDVHIKILQCMYHANINNMVQPGTYERVVNGMFQANNLPKINIPEEFIPPSHLIMTTLLGNKPPLQQQQEQQATETQQQQQQQQQKFQQQHQEQQQRQKQQQQQQQQQQLQKESHQQQQQTQQQQQYKENETPRRAESPQLTQATPASTRTEPVKGKPKQTKISGHDIGLSIYTTRTLGFPENPLKKHSLLEGIRNGTIKYTYTEGNLKESELMEKFVFGMVDTTECLFLVDVDRFRKIKTGLKDIFKQYRPEKQARKDSV